MTRGSSSANREEASGAVANGVSANPRTDRRGKAANGARAGAWLMAKGGDKSAGTAPLHSKPRPQAPGPAPTSLISAPYYQP